MSKGKKKSQASKPKDTPNSDERRTEEDIRNDEQEVAHFRDVQLLISRLCFIHVTGIETTATCI